MISITKYLLDLAAGLSILLASEGHFLFPSNFDGIEAQNNLANLFAGPPLRRVQRTVYDVLAML